MVVFIKIFSERWSVLSLDGHQDCSGFDIRRRICEMKGIPVNNIFLTCDGSILENHLKLNSDQNDHFVHCHLRVPGGKGGFGSMLRAIGAQIEKTTNHEACRDLSGRRMRDVNDEKKIADWLSKKAERDAEKLRRKQERLERLQRKPKHVFEGSTTYTSQIQENMDSIDDALQKGFKSSASGQSTSSLGKRKNEDKAKKSHKKKRTLWLDIDEDLSSDSEEESDSQSSCSSITDSDFSTSEIPAKLPSTTSNGDLPSGNTSEAESSVGKPGQSDENCDNSELKTAYTEKSQSTSGDLYQQQNESTQSHTKSLEQFVKPDKQKASTSLETSGSDNNKSPKSKAEVVENEKSKLQVTEGHENIAKSADTKTELCLSNSTSTSPTTGTEQKCEKTEKQEEEEEMCGESREVKDRTTSSSISLPLNLDQYQSPADLESLGLEVLKSALIALGLKCGGTLQQRAERLFSVKGIPRDKIDPSLFAKQSGKKKEKKR